MAPLSWTDDRVEQLKKLWESGLSASQIAAELGGEVSRNAVIGKVHRLGLGGRKKGGSAGRPRERARTGNRIISVRRSKTSFASITPFEGNAAINVDEEAETAFVDGVVIPMHQRLSLEQLTEETCKWPVGDPTDADFHFCGGPSIFGYPYCAHHCRIAYQPLQDRRRGRK